MNKPLLIKVDKDLDLKIIEKIKEELETKGLNNIVLLPKGFKVATQELGYRVFTRDDYKKYRLSKLKIWDINKNTIKHIDEHFDKISKEYKFIIAAVVEDELTFYSVPYFNEHVLGGKNIEDTTSKTNTKGLTVKLDLDTTEFEEGFNRIEEQLERIKYLKDALEFDKDLEKVKNVTINNNIAIENLAKGFERWISKYIRNE